MFKPLGALSVLLALTGCCCPPAERDAQAGRRKPNPVLEAQFQKAEAVAAAAKSKEQTILEVLARKRVKGLAWEQATLDHALVYLRTITGVDFTVSPKVREEKFDEILINAQLDDVSMETILTVILTEPFELRWEVRDGVVWILTTEEVEGPPRLRYSDVKDLTAERAAWAGREAGEQAEAPAPEDEGARFATGSALVQELQRAVFPSYWKREDATAEARNGILIVRASLAVHHAVARWLAGMRSKLVEPGLPRELASKFAQARVSLAVSDATLAEVVKMLQIQTGYNLTIDSRFAVDVAQNPVTGIKLVDAPLTSALAMLQAAAGAHAVWTGKGNVAVLTHRDFLGL